MSFIAVDRHLLGHVAEQKLVWPFEYRCLGTRYTLVRIGNALTSALMGASILLSTLVDTAERQIIYISAAIVLGYMTDRMLAKAEKEALAEGRARNRYRNRSGFRLAGLACCTVILVTGLAAFELSAGEALCRFAIAAIGACSVYVFCADPVPENWAPRPKQLHWR